MLLGYECGLRKSNEVKSDSKRGLIRMDGFLVAVCFVGKWNQNENRRNGIVFARDKGNGNRLFKVK